MSGDTMNIASSDLNYGSFTESDLFAGEIPIVTRPDLFADVNLVHAQYTVLGRVTASGLLTVCDLGASDGSQVPCAIACQAVDANTAVTAPVYLAGFFNLAKLVWHASFDTTAKKIAAFKYAGSNIQVGTLGYSGG
jgi:hypothetical protein